MIKHCCFIFLTVLAFYSCGDEVIEEVTSAYADESVKSLLRYTGSEEFKDTIETIIFAPNGDTLVWDTKADSSRLERSYHPNDSLKSERTFFKSMKNGVWSVYFDNGDLELQINYQNDKAEGPYLLHHESRKVALKGNFKDGLREGEWQTFDDTGYMIGLCRYSRGVEFIGDGQCREPILWKD